MYKATLAAKASRQLGKYVADDSYFTQYSTRIPISNLEKVRCAFPGVYWCSRIYRTYFYPMRGFKIR